MIEDPLARFYDEGPAPAAGVKNPITGIREETGTAHKQHLRSEEGKRKQQVSKRIITQLMQNDIGREWLYDLLSQCNVFGTPFVLDPISTAYNSGAMHIGRIIESSIKRHSIKEYTAMCQEGLEREMLWDLTVADK